MTNHFLNLTVTGNNSGLYAAAPGEELSRRAEDVLEGTAADP